jgi:transcriptional regulator with XRE-family HTH domain
LTACERLIILISMRHREIAEQVRVWREHRGLSQRALAKAAGLSPVLATKIESGAIADPRLSTLRKLAKALNVTVAEMIGEGKPARKRAGRR